MAPPSSLSIKALAAMILLLGTAQASTKLPVFFFHEVTGGTFSSKNYKANLTAEGHAFNAVDVCSGSCTYRALTAQVSLAIAQIRGIIEKDKATYKNGYIFIGHSQGATIARAVIEQMDEHDVTTFISLAGMQNGLFFGPQAADLIPLQKLAQAMGPAMIPSSLFTFSDKSSDYNGRLQFDLNNVITSSITLNANYALANLMYAPDCDSWKTMNPFLPVINGVNTCNMNACITQKLQRKKNFLRLRKAHFFGSTRDGMVAPYQSSLLGQYTNPSGACTILAHFANLTVLPMNETFEYIHDTYGLQTLHERGDLLLHEVDSVPHQCWIQDTNFYDISYETCIFKDVYNQFIFPLLQ